MPTQWPSHAVGHSAVTPQSDDESDGLGSEETEVEVLGAAETMVARVVDGIGAALTFTAATLSTVSTSSFVETAEGAGVADGLLVLDTAGLLSDDASEVDVEPAPHRSDSEVE